MSRDLKKIKCDKNPGHEGFIPFKDLTLEHLPIEDRNTEILDNIKKMGSVVVRLVVETIQNGRRIKVLGSGYVFKLDNEYFIQTNNHVVKTDDDVKHCIVEFHYDDKNRSDVITSTGVELYYTCPYREISLFRFHPVHDFLHQLDLNDKVPSIVIMYEHNQSKTVKTLLRHDMSLDQLKCYSPLNLNSSMIDLMFISCQDGSISYIKSSYFKFEPNTSDMQELISIEIHIDEDDGNSRVIAGDVVKFGDEFVVKISESIFQDEVQKCRLVWNGEVIGRGTRLYFKQVKSKDILSGIGLKLRMEQGIDNLWLFHCHPLPKYIEDMLPTEQSNNLCCISHPHGDIKMVTFGRVLTKSLGLIDNEYRRIMQPGIDGQYKVVTWVRYSCKTCPGSGGSPVCSLYKGMDLKHGFCHFMCEREGFLLNGEPTGNINIAWLPTSYG